MRKHSALARLDPPRSPTYQAFGGCAVGVFNRHAPNNHPTPPNFRLQLLFVHFADHAVDSHAHPVAQCLTRRFCLLLPTRDFGRHLRRRFGHQQGESAATRLTPFDRMMLPSLEPRTAAFLQSLAGPYGGMTP